MRERTPQMQKSTAKGAFSKMVPLNECPLRYATATRRLWRSNARHHLHSALSDCFRNLVESPLLSVIRINKKRHPLGCLFLLMVPLKRIGLSTPSLPMTCSTTELQRREIFATITKYIELFKNQSLFLYFCKIYVKFLLLSLKMAKKLVSEQHIEV